MNHFTSIFGAYLAISLRAAWWIVALVLLRGLVRRQIPAAIWFWTWIIVGLRLLVPFSFPATWSPYNWSTRLTTESGSAIAAAAVPPLADAAIPSPVPLLPPERASADTTAPAVPFWKNPTVWTGVWLTGFIGLLAARFLLGWRLRRAIRVARPCPPGIVAEVEAEARAIGIEPPACVQTDWVGSPALYGVWRPRLLLPARFVDRLDSAARRLVIRHELIHCRRRDLLVQSLLQFAAILHWFNPLVWLAGRYAAADCELACDEAVLRQGNSSPQDYGTTLLQVLALGNPSARSVATVGIVESRRQLAERLRRIADFRRRPAWQRLAGIGLMAAIAILGISRETHAEPRLTPPAGSPWEEQQKLIAAQEARVAELSKSLNLYREANHLFGIDERRDLAAASVRAAHQSVEAEKSDLATVNARLAQVQDFRQRHVDLLELPFLASQSQIAAKHAELASLREELATLQSRYDERHPKIVEIKARMEGVGNQMTAEIALACKRMEAEAALHSAALKGAQARLETGQRDAVALEQAVAELRDHQRKLEVQEQVLRGLAAGSTLKTDAPGTEFEVKDFVVNVAGTSGNRYLKTSFVVAGRDANLRQQFQGNRARLMNATLNVLSAVTLNDVNDPDVRARLGARLLGAYNETLGQKLAENIYFAEFIVQ